MKTQKANNNKTFEGFGGTMSGYGFTSAGTSFDDEDRLTGYARTDGTSTDVKGNITLLPTVLSSRLTPQASSLPTFVVTDFVVQGVFRP